MPVIPVAIAMVRKRALEILVAMPKNARYTDAIGENADYAVLTEVNDVVLDVDELLVTARLNMPGDPFRSSFMVPVDVADGAFIPAHNGAHGDVDVLVGATYKPARYAKSRDELLAIKANPSLYPDAKQWAYVGDSRLSHNGDGARVWVPSFTRTNACQAPSVDTLAEIAGTVAALDKDGSDHGFHAKCGSYLDWYVATQIKGENRILTGVQEMEAMLRPR